MVIVPFAELGEFVGERLLRWTRDVDGVEPCQTKGQFIGIEMCVVNGRDGCSRRIARRLIGFGVQLLHVVVVVFVVVVGREIEKILLIGQLTGVLRVRIFVRAERFEWIEREDVGLLE